MTDESYSGENYIASVSLIPLLLIHGKADYVIPWQYSEKLYSLAKEPKRLILIPHGEHIDAFSIVTATFIANRWWSLSLARLIRRTNP